MKKIISLLSVFAMLATMFTTVAFADENNAIYWEQDGEIVNNVLTMKLMIKTNENLKAAGARYNLTDAYSKGLTKADVAITATGTDVTANIMDTSVKAISFNLSTTAQDMTGELHILTATFNLANATGDFVLGFAKAFSGSNTAGTRLNNFTAEAYTVKLPVVEPEEPEITINNKYVFNFTADAGEEVMVKLTRTNGIESDLTYSLPELVKGEASIFGLLKVTDDTVVSGDKFDISVVDADRNPVKAITTITVE